MNLIVAFKAYLDLWRPQIAAAKSRGKEFVVGTSYIELLVYTLKGINCPIQASTALCRAQASRTSPILSVSRFG